MRKSRTVVTEVEADKVVTDLNVVFSTLEALEIAVPSWASMLFIFTRLDKKSLDVTFFEDAKDFFIWYSKVLIHRKENLRTISCQYDPISKQWRTLVPPTLIGVNLRTRLR